MFVILNERIVRAKDLLYARKNRFLPEGMLRDQPTYGGLQNDKQSVNLFFIASPRSFHKPIRTAG